MESHVHRTGELVKRKPAFTLLEVIIAVAIIGMLAGITYIVLNPGEKLSRADSARRKESRLQIENAVAQFQIDMGTLPDASKIPEGQPNAVSICKDHATNFSACVDLRPLIPHYIVSIPFDLGERCPNVTGYKIYLDHGRPQVIIDPTLLNVSAEQGNASTCPVAIVKDNVNPNIWSINGGTYTPTVGAFSVPMGIALTVDSNGVLNLNGHDTQIQGALTNNGTLMARGTETCILPSGSYAIGNVTLNGGDAQGNNKCLSDVGGHKVITNLELSFTNPDPLQNIFAPVSNTEIHGDLIVGPNSALSTINGGVHVGGNVSNQGIISFGSDWNKNVFSNNMDSKQGEVLIQGQDFPAYTYHDLIIASNAAFPSSTSVDGMLRVNSGSQLFLNGKLNVKGDVDVQGVLTGSGTVALVGATQNVTVQPSASLRGIAIPGVLTITNAPSTQKWTLNVAAGNPHTLKYLVLHNAQASTPITCEQCVDNGGNVNITFRNPVECAVTAHCASGLWCGSDSKCHATCTEGFNPTECPRGYNICDRNNCFQGNCMDESTCNGYACVNYSCVQPGACQVLSDCATGNWCGQDHVCRNVCNPADNGLDCPATTWCNPQTYQCSNSCGSDLDCPTNWWCGQNGVCNQLCDTSNPSGPYPDCHADQWCGRDALCHSSCNGQPGSCPRGYSCHQGMCT